MARGIWKGTLSFGLVNIGVELLPVESPESIDLDLLDKRDMAHVGYQKINKSTGRAIPSDQVVKGYDVGGGKYVILQASDIREANPRATQSIEVLGFVPAGTIPLLYFAKPYLIAPTKGSAKAYALFRETLEREDQVGIAQLVVRTRQYVAAVYPHEDFLMVQLLRYDEEIHLPAKVAAAGARSIRPEERTMAKQLIAGMAMTWRPAAYRDEYRADLLKLIKRRARGAKAAAEAMPEAPEETRVIDLMAALKKSLARKGSRGARTTGRAAPAKKRAKAAKPALRRSA